MKVQEFEKLVDYVADLRSKLQHARARETLMVEHMTLLFSSDAPMVEVSLWRDAMDDHTTFIENLRTQLTEYETLLGWPLTTEPS